VGSGKPYPTPNRIERGFLVILEAVSFVDKIFFGRTNCNTEISKYKNAKAFSYHLSKQDIDFCDLRNIEYHIKEGTMTDIQK